MKKEVKKLKRLKFLLVTLIVLVLLLSLGVAGVSSSSATQQFGAGRILVKFVPGAAAAEVANAHRAVGGAIVETIPGIDVQIVRVPAGREKELVSRYLRNKNVLYAEPDFIAQASVVPNDTYFSNQWGMSKVEAPLAWDVSKSSSNIRVAVLDTGIDAGHGDIKPKVVAAKNFTTSKTVSDRNGHGTHVAGIAAAVTNNSKGVAGLGWNASLMNGKVLGDDGSGFYSWVASGIVWAADNGAKAINMSLGGSSPSKVLEDAVNYAWDKGSVLVAAAGNNNTSDPVYPAFYANVIAVAATDQNDNKASFSSFGSWVDVSAPGVNILSTYPRTGIVDRYAWLSGTSMSSPHVAGLAALVWTTTFGSDKVSVRDRIESTVDPLNDTSIGKGRINAAKAVGAK